MPEPADLSEEARRLRRHQVAQLARHPLRLACETARALIELAWARRVLARLTMPEIELRNRQAQATGASLAVLPDPDLVDRVAVILPLVAWRVPWRSDCLVQALAAQRWLGASGVASRIVIGADSTEKEGFVAHAWLMQGDRVVTGGEVDRYTVLFDSPEPHGN